MHAGITDPHTVVVEQLPDAPSLQQGAGVPGGAALHKVRSSASVSINAAGAAGAGALPTALPSGMAPGGAVLVPQLVTAPSSSPPPLVGSLGQGLHTMIPVSSSAGPRRGAHAGALPGGVPVGLPAIQQQQQVGARLVHGGVCGIARGGAGRAVSPVLSSA